MTSTPKHEKLLAMAASRNGAPLGLYGKEASELLAAGKLERRIVHTAVGATKIQLFLSAA